MAHYNIIFLPKAEKYLVDLDDDNYGRVEESVEEIRKNPYKKRPKADIIKLRGYKFDAFLRSSDSDYR